LLKDAPYYYTKGNKPNCSGYRRLQDPSEINEDNLNNIRHETSRHFGNKKWEYLKDKIDELATNSMNKTYAWE
jgi:hypothetical protein